MTALRSWKLARIVTVGAIVIGIFSGLYYYRSKTSTEAIPARVGPVIEAVYGLGTVIAPQTYQVKTAVNQSIKDLFVKEGDSVKAGAPLIQFDESGVFRAPFAGTITSIPLRKGELIFPSTPALTLVNLKDLYLEVLLEQQAVLRVQSGQRAEVSFESIRGDKIEGKVRSIFPRDSQFIVVIGVDRLPETILPGMTADVAIEIARKQNVLSIPLRALSAGRVTLRRGGKTLKLDVKIGVVDGLWAEVTQGDIRPSDELLVRPR